MTIINPNSIAGITSVTAEAGVMNFYKSDGTLAGLQLNGVNFNTTAGVSTFNDVYVGGTITYEDVKNVDSIGIITARTGIIDSTLTAGRVVYVDSDKSLTDSANLTFNGNNVTLEEGRLFVKRTTIPSVDVRNSTNTSYSRVILQQGAAEGGYFQISREGTNSSAGAGANSVELNQSSNHPLTIKTNNTERLRITGAGRIGINETSPDTDLHIKNTNPAIILEGTNGSGRQHKIWSAGTNSEALQFTSGNVYYNADAHYFRKSNESTEHLRITSTGLVTNKGTWTNTYAANDTTQCGYQAQNLSDTTNTYAALRLTAGSSSPATAQIASVRTGTGQNDLTFQLESSNTAFEALRITSSGNVGINDNNPDNQLVVKAPGGSGHTTAKVTSGDETTSMVMQAIQGSEGRLGMNTNHPLAIYAGALEKVRILSGGEVCIGRNSAVVSDTKLNIQCDATKGAIAIQCGHTNTDTDLITAWNSGGKNIVNITAETDNSPYLKFEILSGNSPVERFRVNHLGNVSIGGGTAPNRLEIIDDHQGFPSDSAQPHASLLIKHGTSGSNRRWVGIGASLTGAWLQSSSPGGSGLSAPFWINKGGGDVTLGNDRLKVTSSGDVCIGATAPVSAEKLYVLNGSAISGRSIDPLTAVLFESAECRLQLQSDNTGNNASTIILSNDNKHWMIQQRATGKSNNFQIGYYAGTAGDLSNLSSYALQIKTNGVAQFSTTGSFDTYTTADNAYQFRHDFTNVAGVWISNTNTSHTKELLRLDSARSGSSSFYLFNLTTGNLGDDQFLFRADGNAYSDGGYWAGGADYAEYFEWTDGNSSDEDRRGMTVVLDGNKVKPSTSSDSADDIIGVVSASPVVVGDSAYMQWTDKYLRDDYGAYDLDENGERKLNPSYDDTKTYVRREDRKEWDTIGMVGKLRIRKGQKTGTRWIKMRDISDSIEEWLVR